MPHEQIRKQWLTFFLINPLLGLPLFFLSIHMDPQWALLSDSFRHTFYVFFVVFMGLIYYVTYHCCYKKRGTKLLAFLLSTAILSTAHTLYTFGNNPILSRLMEIPYYKPLYFLSWGLSIPWFIVNIRLWKANREWRKQTLPT